MRNWPAAAALLWDPVGVPETRTSDATWTLVIHPLTGPGSYVKLFRTARPGRADDRKLVGSVHWDAGHPLESLDDFLKVLALLVDADWSHRWPWRVSASAPPWGPRGGSTGSRPGRGTVGAVSYPPSSEPGPL